MEKQKSNQKTKLVGAEPVSAQNAITLVALVITVIILLILAGVTINLTLGNNGIFNTAQKAAKNYTEAQNKELAELNDFNETVQALSAKLGTIIKTENNINYTADGAGNIIPVPAGFSPITTEEGQGTKKTGFVIRNDADKNEFVWVPVSGMGYTYDRYDFGKQKGTYLDYSEAMPSDEKTSVETYGGYYIGRYEAGIASATAKSGDKNKTAEEIETTWGKVLSQKEKLTYNWVTKEQAKALAERVYTKANNNVTSKLCSSYAWDTALKFIEIRYPEYLTNSTQGNYSGKLEKTGQTIAVNNIYDMGGNVWECTTEAYNISSTPCVIRGGNKDSGAQSGAVSQREMHADCYGGYIAFRVTLFI